jgi:hypothetical protein
MSPEPIMLNPRPMMSRWRVLIFLLATVKSAVARRAVF